MIEKAKQPLIFRIRQAFRKDWQLFLMCLLPVIYFIVFHYLPMYGVRKLHLKIFRQVRGFGEVSGQDLSTLKDSSNLISSGL